MKNSQDLGLKKIDSSYINNKCVKLNSDLCLGIYNTNTGLKYNF